MSEENRERTPLRVMTCSRTLRAMELRIAGASFDEVGLELGVTPERAEKICSRAHVVLGAIFRRMALLENKVEALQRELQHRKTIRKRLLLEPILDEDPISMLLISTRAENALRREGIQTIGQLCQMSPKQLLSIGRCGFTTVDNIQAALLMVERHLRDWPPTEPQSVQVWLLRKSQAGANAEEPSPDGS